MGNLTLACSVPIAVLFLANVRSRILYHGPSYSFLGWMFIYGLVTGIGLRAERKWAAVLFAVPCHLTGIFLVAGSLWKVPFPWMLINIGFGGSLLYAATMLMKEWRLLRWT